MNGLSDGARMHPLRRLSIRVPWNDTSWAGVVCARPNENISCLVLPRISETRNDQAEVARAGIAWNQLSQDELPACIGEHGSFMAPFEIVRKIKYPPYDLNDICGENHCSFNKYRISVTMMKRWIEQMHQFNLEYQFCRYASYLGEGTIYPILSMINC